MVRGIALAAACYVALLALANAGVGLRDSAPTVGTLVMSVLLILAPAGLALPAGQKLAAPLWAWETIISWAALGALVFLVDPRGLGRTPALSLLLLPLVGACASPALLLAAWWSPGQSPALRRCGYGVAAFPAGLLVLSALGALTPITALLFGFLFAACSFLWYVASAGTAPEVEAESDLAEAPAPEAPIEEVRPILRPVIAFAGQSRIE